MVPASDASRAHERGAKERDYGRVDSVPMPKREPEIMRPVDAGPKGELAEEAVASGAGHWVDHESVSNGITAFRIGLR